MQRQGRDQQKTQEEDQHLWRLFFKKAEGVFEHIVNDKDWFVNHQLEKLAKDIWDNELRKKLDLLSSYILNNELTEDAYLVKVEKLGGVGLTGNQLKFKINVFEYWFSMGAKGLGRLLAVINSIVGSLTYVFPPVEAIKEFKDFLEHSRKLVVSEADE